MHRLFLWFGITDEADKKTRVLMMVCGVAILALLIEFIGVLWVEWSGVLDDDALIYMAMGRGILNGLIPYRDLFETKPPGIFLLAAASQFLGGIALAKFVQVLALVIIPLSIIIPARRILRPIENTTQRILYLFACITGLLLALFTELFSGGFQVESMGASAAIVYVALVAMKPHIWTSKRMLLASIPIGVAVFFKEPFILSIFAGALLLAPSLISLLTIFFIPAAIAGAGVLLLLMLLGYLGPYFFYLQYMLTQGTTMYNGPLPLRGFYVNRILANAWQFSPLWSLFLIALVALAFFFVWKRSSAPREKILRSHQILFALYLGFLAIGTGGDFFGHHFIFAVPAYGALLLLIIREARHIENIRRMPIVLLIALALTTAFLHTRENPVKKVRAWQSHDESIRTAAATIDQVLDRCDIENYLYLVSKGGGPFGYTHHSPLGPIFLNHNRFLTLKDSPFLNFIRDQLLTAQVIVIEDQDSSGMTDDGWKYITLTFTSDPPECARLPLQPLPYRLLFRNEISH